MIIKGRTINAHLVTEGTDEVIGAIPIPPGGKFLSVEGEIHIVGAEAFPTNDMLFWGLSGHLVPVTDPDTAMNLNNLWDFSVIKAVDPTVAAGTNLIDFDYDTLDTATEIEPGEMDLSELTGLLDPTKEFIPPRLEVISFANAPTKGWVAGSPDTYTPTDFKRFRSKRRLTADEPSYAMLGFSNPGMGDQQTSRNTLATPAAWAIMENMRDVLGDFWKLQAGMIEAGAESPYDLVGPVLQDMMAPDMTGDANIFGTAMTFMVFCLANWTISLPESSVPNVIDPR